jgi:TnpA family transposase
MTDTAAYADTVFGLFWLLGYQFSPRLADIGDARFWRIERTADYGPLGSTFVRLTVESGRFVRSYAGPPILFRAQICQLG